MTRPPEPRPALRRSNDGTVHPAAPRAAPEKHLQPAPVTSIAPAADSGFGPYKPGDLRARKAAKAAKSANEAKGHKGKKSDETVPLEVRIPKKLRKALRKRAGSEGGTVDEVVTDALYTYLA